MMNDRVRSGFTDRSMLKQLFGFCAGISLIAYFAGGVGFSHAAAIFMVLWVCLLGCWFASSAYPSIAGYR